MTINQMRAFILHEYPDAGMAFREKVTKMKPSQVIAIYKSIQNRKIGYKTTDRTNDEYHQMDIFEYLAEKSATSDVPGNHTEVEVSTL